MYNEKRNRIDKMYPCPSEHQKNFHNRALEESRFEEQSDALKNQKKNSF